MQRYWLGVKSALANAYKIGFHIRVKFVSCPDWAVCTLVTSYLVLHQGIISGYPCGGFIRLQGRVEPYLYKHSMYIHYPHRAGYDGECWLPIGYLADTPSSYTKATGSDLPLFSCLRYDL